MNTAKAAHTPKRLIGITVKYFSQDGGWYKVMRDGNCVEDFRDPLCADSYARALRKEARAAIAKATGGQ